MPTLASTPPANWGLCVPPPVVSADLAAGYANFSERLWAVSLKSAGSGDSKTTPGALPVEHVGIMGASIPWRWLHDRVLVLPRTYNAGFMITTLKFDIEVWSTHTDEISDLTSITTSGTGGLSIDGPAAMQYGPLQSQGYTVTLAPGLTPVVNAVATWNFTGESGADITILGSWVVPFSIRPDWSEPFREAPCYATSILPGYSGAEQRIQTRLDPRWRYSFRAVALTQQIASYLEALLYGWQDKLYGVPCWPETTYLTAPAGPGEISVHAVTTNLPTFGIDGLVMLWLDERTFEVFTVASLASGVINLNSQIVGAWPIGTRVIPLRLGFLSADQAEELPTNYLAAGTFTFECGGF